MINMFGKISVDDILKYFVLFILPRKQALTLMQIVY